MKKNCLLIGCLLFVSALFAQQTSFYKNPQNRFGKAVELYNKGKFNAAKNQFSLVEKDPTLKDCYIKSEAAFFSALCDAKLFHQNSGKALEDFIGTYPTSSRISEAVLELAAFYYRNKDYSKALEFYAQVEVKELTEEQLTDYYFRSAYSFFMLRKYDDAKLGFYQIKQGTSKYLAVATYYYAYILYTEGNYQSAYNDFVLLKNDENFGAIIPYYILQINYAQQKYDSILKHGPVLLPKASPKRAAEISRLIGEAYYYSSNYFEALNYLKIYFKQSAVRPNRNDNYMMGYSYFKLDKFDTAITYFQAAIADKKSDVLEQSALYHLGYCYVQRDLKSFAMNSFLDASKLKFNAKIQEDATYNYVKLAYELGLSPYSESINVVQSYLSTYPTSPYQEEMKTYLVLMMLKTKNYKEALVHLEKLERMGPQLLEAYQRVAYNRGIELFYEKKYEEAIKLFELAIEKSFHEWMSAQAMYWKGESYFKMGKYNLASQTYERFLFSPEVKKAPSYIYGEYSFAYSLFQEGKYELALKHLDLFFKQENKDSSLLSDAYTRAGDANFMLKDYKKSLAYYDKGLAQKNVNNADYLLYQKALALGALGQYDAKIKLLLSFIEQQSSSLLMSSALNELALTYLITDDSDKAMRYYKQIAEKYSKSTYARTALMKQGLINFNQGKTEQALKLFEKVIEDFPTTQDAKLALVSIRNIYISMNRVDEFFTYAKKFTNTKIEESEQDSITFLASENKFMEEKYASAKTGFTTYLTKFPQGFFVLQAQYYLAECAYKEEDYNTARQYYELVSKADLSSYSERSTLRAAKLNYDIKKYSEALEFYKRLRTIAQTKANINLALMYEMKCYHYLNEPISLISTAQQLLKQEDISQEVRDETRLYIARAALSVGDKSLALKEFKNLSTSKNPDYSGEAKYYLIENLVQNGDLKAAEKDIFDYISGSPSNDYFIAKTYILWAEIYKLKGNYLQAKQTLQSIIDNFEGEDLVNLSKKRLDEIISIEKAQQEKEEQERSLLYPEDVEIVIPEM